MKDLSFRPEEIIKAQANGVSVIDFLPKINMSNQEEVGILHSWLRWWKKKNQPCATVSYEDENAVMMMTIE